MSPRTMLELILGINQQISLNKVIIKKTEHMFCYLIIKLLYFISEIRNASLTKEATLN